MSTQEQQTPYEYNRDICDINNGFNTLGSCSKKVEFNLTAFWRNRSVNIEKTEGAVKKYIENVIFPFIKNSYINIGKKGNTTGFEHDTTYKNYISTPRYINRVNNYINSKDDGYDTLATIVINVLRYGLNFDENEFSQFSNLLTNPDTRLSDFGVVEKKTGHESSDPNHIDGDAVNTEMYEADAALTELLSRVLIAHIDLSDNEIFVKFELDETPLTNPSEFNPITNTPPDDLTTFLTGLLTTEPPNAELSKFLIQFNQLIDKDNEKPDPPINSSNGVVLKIAFIKDQIHVKIDMEDKPTDREGFTKIMQPDYTELDLKNIDKGFLANFHKLWTLLET